MAGMTPETVHDLPTPTLVVDLDLFEANVAAAAGSAEATVGAVVDVDIGLGRCGVPDAEAARALSLAVVAERHLRFDGLMGYEGRFPDPAGPRDRVSAAYALLAEAKAAVEDAGIAVALV